MKFCIGIMFQNEADWLRLHLPVLMQSCNNLFGDTIGLVGLDGGSEDNGADIIRSFGGTCYEHPYSWPPIHQHNKLIEVCEASGYDAMVKVDPDELFYPEHIRQMVNLLREFKVLRFPTYHFIGDRLHFSPLHWYPDPHDRAWRLNIGIRWVGEFHSVPNVKELGFEVCTRDNDLSTDILYCPHIHLYHYGHIKDPLKRALRATNIQRVWKQGLPPIDNLPDDIEVRLPWRIPFVGPQPIAPHVVGIKAPVE